MFGSRKKKILKIMSTLTSVAQLSVALTLNEEHEEEMGKEKSAAFSAAVANYLFGKPINHEILKQRNIDLNKIKNTGDMLIKNNPGTRELVVQSLRILHAIAAASGEDIAGMEILSTYGGEYPNSPGQDDYTALVAKTVTGLSPRAQQAIAQLRK